MMSSSYWESLPDKGPIEQDFHNEVMGQPYVKPRSHKKKFVIECRYTGPEQKWLFQYFEDMREWHTHKRYATERARSQAWHTLQRRKDKDRYSHHYSQYEYRIKDLQ